jgi:predicted DNA-binding protein YlxM (UPF0122 family)
MPRGNPTLQDIAQSYGISRQQIYNIKKSLKLTREDMLDPEKVFQAMLRRFSSDLRIRLADPAKREAIQQKLTTHLQQLPT